MSHNNASFFSLILYLFLFSSVEHVEGFSAIAAKSAPAMLSALINESKCFTSESGASEFASACATNVLYEDCFEPQPIVGRFAVEQHLKQRAEMRSQRENSGFRVDRISDGTKACGFAWTWTCGDLEGLRGTTFVELNDNNEIVYVREIPEPIFKPGDATLELLKAVTAGAEAKVFDEPLVPREPTNASDLVRYLFEEVQGRDISEAMKLFSENIIYRDFNYEDVLQGKEEVQKFIEDFSFPGIEFKFGRVDDGETSSCFTYDVTLMDAPETVKLVSFYEIDPETKKITYVRDVPESAIKPPILGSLARKLRPGLGVFQGVPIGSRPNGS